MQDSFFVECSDESVLLDYGKVTSGGFQPNSWYFLYFLDHGTSNRLSTLHELLLLPVGLADLRRLYSVRIGIRNVPGATGQAFSLLADRRADIKVCKATDSIAGNEGTIEALVLLPEGVTPKRLDHEAVTATAKAHGDAQKYLSSRRETPIDHPNGYYAGRFVEGISFFDQFVSERESTRSGGHSTPGETAAHFFESRLRHVTGERVQLRPLLPKHANSAAEQAQHLEVQLPHSILLSLAQKYHKNRLDDYHAAATIEPTFNSLSLSFLDPSDVILSVRAQLLDIPKTLFKVTSWLGKEGIDFRIFDLANVEVSKRLQLYVHADYSRTDFSVYGLKTLTWKLCAELTDILPDPPVPMPKIQDLRIDRQYGYPRRLPGFMPAHRFEILDFIAVPRAASRGADVAPGAGARADRGDGAILHMRTSKLLQACGVVPEMDSIERLDDVLRALEAWIQSPADDAVEERTLAGHVFARTRLHETVTEYRLRPPTDELHESRSGGGQRFSVTIWRRQMPNHALALVFMNAPPPTLLRALAALEPATAVAEQQVFEFWCAQLLKDQTYQFGTEEEFQRRGRKWLPDVFVREARNRFGSERLVRRYIEEKFELDRFPIEANLLLAQFFGEYARERGADGGETIRVLDVGCAGGALTALTLLRKSPYWTRLLEGDAGIELHLVDVSEEVLAACREGRFVLPEQFAMTDLNMASDDLDRYRRALRRARTHAVDVSRLAEPGALESCRLENDWFDVVVSGFCHHHMNDEMRRKACAAMVALAKPGGFIGIADETMTFKQHVEYRMNHLRDEVPYAAESFITKDEHIELFQRAGYTHHKDEPCENYYVFWGSKTDSPDKASAQKAQTHDVYVSYKWGGESEATVTRLKTALQERGLSLQLDKSRPFRASIDEFAAMIGRSRAVIVVLGRDYFESKHCMRELVEIARHADFRKRIFPLLLPGTPFGEQDAMVAHTRFWRNRLESLRRQWKELGDDLHERGAVDDLRGVREIVDALPGVFQQLRDMNLKTLESHEAAGFDELLEDIQAQLRTDSRVHGDTRRPG